MSSKEVRKRIFSTNVYNSDTSTNSINNDYDDTSSHNHLIITSSNSTTDNNNIDINELMENNDNQDSIGFQRRRIIRRNIQRRNMRMIYKTTMMLFLLLLLLLLLQLLNSFINIKKLMDDNDDILSMIMKKNLYHHENKHNNIITGRHVFQYDSLVKLMQKQTNEKDLDVNNIGTKYTASSWSYYPIFDIQDILDQNEENFVSSTLFQNTTTTTIQDIYKLIYKKNNNHQQQKRVIINNKNNMVVTRRGYKGGLINDQINQDRAIIIDSFLLNPLQSSQTMNDSRGGNDHDRIMKDNVHNDNTSMMIGIFDGHGQDGHQVAHFVQVRKSFFCRIVVYIVIFLFSLWIANNSLYSIQSKIYP